MWQVTLSRDASKAIRTLPRIVQERALALMKEIEVYGPARGEWHNYSKLSGARHHCHIKNGRPTYIMVWQVTDPIRKTVEVKYVGTREGAPY